jgi:hypothetical protein
MQGNSKPSLGEASFVIAFSVFLGACVGLVVVVGVTLKGFLDFSSLTWFEQVGERSLIAAALVGAVGGGAYGLYQVLAVKGPTE